MIAPGLVARSRAAFVLAGCAIAIASAACTPAEKGGGDSRDDRPVVVDSVAALAPIGITIPPFSYPSVRGWKFDRPRLAYGHTVVALVDSGAKGSDPAIQEFDSLRQRYRSSVLRWAIIFNRGVEARDSTSDTARWTHSAEVGFAGSRIADAWAPGTRDTSDPKRRIELRLPSFLVISDSGRVLARAAGRPFSALRPVLDSLQHVRDSAQAAEGAATIAQARPALERAFRAFDPVTLRYEDSVVVRLDGTCGGEETVTGGIIPATIRLVKLDPRNPGVMAYVEIVSVADVEPIGEEDICAARELAVTPRITTGRYRIDFFWNSATPDVPGSRAAWATSSSIRAVADSESYAGTALVPLGEEGKRYVIPAGVTLAMLRARVDSIRRARK